MPLPKLTLVGLLVALLASACGADRPTLGNPDSALATGTAGDVVDSFTATAGDVLDGATQTALDVADSGPDDAPSSPLLIGGPAFKVNITEEFGHDSAAFTQGLEFDGELLYESRGQLGESALTEISPDTGDVLRSVPVDDDFFAEGLTRVDDRLIQLTWQNGVAFVYDLTTFEVVGHFRYGGEGWGLCYDGTTLFMSDGTSFISERDPETFELVGAFEVTLDGWPVTRLNELECLDGLIWANVLQTEFIAVIDPGTGKVVAEIDASALRAAIPGGQDLRELNGIAYDAEFERVILTGKYWPTMFAVDFDPCASPCVPAPFPTLGNG